MAEPITMQKLTDASLDADSIEVAVNGDELTDVETRLGETYPSIKKAVRLIMENGLLGAQAFKTYDLMVASALVDGDYAIVTDGNNSNLNGIYRKEGGAWVYSQYNNFYDASLNPILSAMIAISDDSASKVAADNNLDIAWGVVDRDNNVALAVTNSGNLMASGAVSGYLGDNSEDYAYAITDKDNNIAFGIKHDGTVDIPSSALSQTGSLLERSKDVFYITGNKTTQLTSTANNESPSFNDATSAKYVSDRLGYLAEYAVNLDATDERLLYADNRKYEQVITTGQSLAQGGANAAISTTAPYSDNAFRFTSGAIASNDTPVNPTLTPLNEQVMETISTGFGKKLLSQKLDRTLLMSGQAWGGKSYDELKKGGASGVFEKCVAQAKAGYELNGSSNVRSIFNIHGEQDGINGNTVYDQNLRTWLDDFNSSIKAVNNQSDNIVMLICQTSSVSGYKSTTSRDTFTTPFLQLKASKEYNDIHLVCPKYHFTYVDHAHIDAVSTRTLGEYYAKTYRQVVIEGKPWKPLQPNTVTKTGSTIVIDFDVPKPPLVFDTTLVTEGADNTNKGFTLRNAGAVTITGVAITGASQVTITLSAPAPTNSVLTYAFNNGTDGKSGWQQGARGNIRDSETEKSAYTSANLYNWCVTFKHTFEV